VPAQGLGLVPNGRAWCPLLRGTSTAPSARPPEGGTWCPLLGGTSTAHCARPPEGGTWCPLFGGTSAAHCARPRCGGSFTTVGDQPTGLDFSALGAAAPSLASVSLGLTRLTTLLTTRLTLRQKPTTPAQVPSTGGPPPLGPEPLGPRALGRCGGGFSAEGRDRLLVEPSSGTRFVEQLAVSPG
jgi:hypothetical protein